MATAQENHDAMQAAITAKNTRKACMFALALASQLEALDPEDPLGVNVTPIDLSSMPGREVLGLKAYVQRIQAVVNSRA